MSSVSVIASRGKAWQRVFKTKQQLAHAPSRRIISAWVAVALLLVSLRALLGEGSQTTIERFKELYGNVRDYKEFRLLTLNGEHYVVAFWNEDNDPLQLWTSIFRYSDEQLQMPVYKVFSGDVSERVLAIDDFDLSGSGRNDLLVLSKSGQIEIVRVLREQGKDLVLAFENGGSDVTVLKERREIWIKSRTGKQVDVYRWDGKGGKFICYETVPVVF